jgi:predicted kinase
MKERIEKINEFFDKQKVLLENKKLKTRCKNLAKDYDMLFLDNISLENEINILKEENKFAQKQKREYIIAYKHQKEELKKIKTMLMQEGTTLKDIKNALGVK